MFKIVRIFQNLLRTMFFFRADAIFFKFTINGIKFFVKWLGICLKSKANINVH
jgi:hypothetical protein